MTTMSASARSIMQHCVSYVLHVSRGQVITNYSVSLYDNHLLSIILDNVGCPPWEC